MSKVFLKVPFPEKDEVKLKGGKFEPESKLWYCYSKDLHLFHPRWPVFINCPFPEKDEAKKKGALYDGEKKLWYINPEVNLNSFAKWLPHDSIRDKESISHKKEDKDRDTSSFQESTTKKVIEGGNKDSVQESATKKQKKEKKEDSIVTQVNINVQVNPSSNKPSSAEAALSTAELTKIKGTIKDGCAFDVPTLKGLLKERGVKGLSKLSKQQLIDQCIDMKVLKPVLQLQIQPQTQSQSQYQPVLPVSDTYEKKRKSEKDIAYF